MTTGSFLRPHLWVGDGRVLVEGVADSGGGFWVWQWGDH